jgi:anti-sigma regulatory factor (Ser/Thr protein kinase)
MAIENRAMEYEQEIAAAATIEQLPFISDFVERIMAASGFDSRKVMEVLLVMEEACTNIAKYAYPGGDGIIRIFARVYGDQLVLTIEDYGVEFDPTAFAPILSQADASEHPVGGLGIHLMRCFVDEMNFQHKDGKNVLTLVKNRIRTF